MSSFKGWDGVERRHTSWVFKYRWRILSVWCIIFSVIVSWQVGANRDAINQLDKTQATTTELQRVIQELEKTNYTLCAFLVSAANTRQRTADKERKAGKDDLALTDSLAAQRYRDLATIFDHDGKLDCV